MTWNDWDFRCLAMSPDSRVTRSARSTHVALRANMYHRFSDGARTDNPTRPAAAAGRARSQDAEVLVADRDLRGGRRRLVVRVRDDARAQLPVVGHAVLSGADPIEPAAES